MWSDPHSAVIKISHGCSGFGPDSIELNIFLRWPHQPSLEGVKVSICNLILLLNQWLPVPQIMLYAAQNSFSGLRRRNECLSKEWIFFLCGSGLQTDRRSQELPFLARMKNCEKQMSTVGPPLWTQPCLFPIHARKPLKQRGFLHGRLRPDWQKACRQSQRAEVPCYLLSKGVTYHLWEVPINSLPSNIRSEPELQKCIKDTKHIVWRTFKGINLYRKNKRKKRRRRRRNGKKSFLHCKGLEMTIEIYSGKSVTLKKKESFLKSV